MLKVWTRLSLLMIVVLLSLGITRDAPSSDVASSDVSGRPAACAESAPAGPAQPLPSRCPCTPDAAATTAELDGSLDEVADPELALSHAPQLLVPSARSLQRSRQGGGYRLAVLEAPFKPPNR